MKNLVKSLAAFFVLIVLFVLYGYQTKEKKKYEFNGR